MIAEIATSKGNRSRSIAGKSITTEVSIKPRGGRTSATGRRILINHRIDILPKAHAGDARRSDEGGVYRVGGHEYALTERTQLPNRDTIPRDDKGPALVQIAHDSAAFVAELSLGDPTRHSPLL